MSSDYIVTEKDRSIIESEELKEYIFNYLVNYSTYLNNLEQGCLWSISDILANIEMHVVVMYYTNKLNEFPKLKEFAELIVSIEEKERNLFMKKNKEDTK